LSEGFAKSVYAAYSRLTGSWKVLKVYKEAPSPEELEREIQTLRSDIHHENIVRMDSPQLVEGRVWIIEEELDGTFQELAPLADRHEYADYARQISSALSYLHSRRIVHGDIHLRNCGYINGVAKLLDFGRATYERNEHHAVAGVRGYICTRSPEQFDDPPSQLTRAIDMWSFGCTLYALRTGEYPFIDGSELSTHHLAREKGNDSAVQEIESLVRTRADKGLASGFATRHRDRFDDFLWETIAAAVSSRKSQRIPADKMYERLSQYWDESKAFLAEAPRDSVTMRTGARRLLDDGAVARLAWFEERVSKGERARADA
jgi:serine/threonine protein kinase